MRRALCGLACAIPLLPLFGGLLLLPGCELLTEDSCGTTRPNVHVDVTYTLTVTRIGAGQQRPYVECILDITTVKQLCEGGSKGAMSFPDSRLNQQGQYTFTVGYNLTNSDDSIVMDVDAKCPAELVRETHRVSYDQAAAAGGRMNVAVQMFSLF